MHHRGTQISETSEKEKEKCNQAQAIPEGSDQRNDWIRLPEYRIGGQWTQYAIRYKTTHRIQDRWE